MESRTRRDPLVALILEVVLGTLFAALGIGWIYAGRIGTGLVLLVGYYLLAGVLAVILVIGTLGVWCLLLPVQNLIFGAISGYFAYQAVEAQNSSF